MIGRQTNPIAHKSIFDILCVMKRLTLSRGRKLLLWTISTESISHATMLRQEVLRRGFLLCSSQYWLQFLRRAPLFDESKAKMHWLWPETEKTVPSSSNGRKRDVSKQHVKLDTRPNTTVPFYRVAYQCSSIREHGALGSKTSEANSNWPFESAKYSSSSLYMWPYDP